MNANIIPRNHTSFKNTIGITARSISLFQEEKLTNIFELVINQNIISIAEPVDIQKNELGNDVITMYQLVGDIDDNKVQGLESILNYITNNFHTKDDSAINQHNYGTAKKNYFQDFATYNSNKVDKSKTCNIKTHVYRWLLLQ